jgi:hypothetical protein
VPLIGRRGVRTFFLFFLFVLTICEEGRRSTDTISYTMNTQHRVHFMTELNSSVDLYEIYTAALSQILAMIKITF